MIDITAVMSVIVPIMRIIARPTSDSIATMTGTRAVMWNKPAIMTDTGPAMTVILAVMSVIVGTV